MHVNLGNSNIVTARFPSQCLRCFNLLSALHLLDFEKFFRQFATFRQLRNLIP